MICHLSMESTSVLSFWGKKSNHLKICLFASLYVFERQRHRVLLSTNLILRKVSIAKVGPGRSQGQRLHPGLSGGRQQCMHITPSSAAAAGALTCGWNYRKEL